MLLQILKQFLLVLLLSLLLLSLERVAVVLVPHHGLQVVVRLLLHTVLSLMFLLDHLPLQLVPVLVVHTEPEPLVLLLVGVDQPGAVDVLLLALPLLLLALEQALVVVALEGLMGTVVDGHGSLLEPLQVVLAVVLLPLHQHLVLSQLEVLVLVLLLLLVPLLQLLGLHGLLESVQHLLLLPVLFLHLHFL